MSSVTCNKNELVFQFNFRFCGTHHAVCIINHLAAEMESIHYWLPHTSENPMLFTVHLYIHGPRDGTVRQAHSHMQEFMHFLDAVDQFNISINYFYTDSFTYHVVESSLNIEYQF